MPTKSQQPIRVLHLSDVHFKTSRKWDADPVLRSLAHFVRAEVETGLVPDLVALTGDIAHAGLAKEYALARTWLDDLWKTLNSLPRDRLLLVPGNHDVDRSKVGTGVRSIQDGLLNAKPSELQDEIAAVLSDDEERRIMLRRHAAFVKFVRAWFSDRQSMPWWRRVIDIRGILVHVAGLDSAWMACKDKEQGSLLLGRWQVTQTVRAEGAEKAHWRIALLHHPWNYLADLDQGVCRADVQRHCDLLLRGHRHRTDPEHVVRPDPDRGCLELAAGCVYEASDYPNAFQWIELSPPLEKRVRVRFFVWNEGAWIVDQNRPGCVDGWWEVDLAAPPTTASRATVRPPRRSRPNMSNGCGGPARTLASLARRSRRAKPSP